MGSKFAAELIALLLPFLFFSGHSFAADPARDFLNAARKGDLQRVRTLLAAGAPLQAKDKKGHNALFLAAENHHAEVVAELLQRNSRPVPLRLAMAAQLAPDNLYGSCLLSPQELVKQMAAIRPETMVAEEVRLAAGSALKGLVEWVAPGGSAPLLELKVRPGISCPPRAAADSVSVAIDARLLLPRESSPLLEKTFGGGLKGLHTRTARSPAQYPGLMEEWARGHAAAILWEAVAALVGRDQ
jgi:hypothetical protein